MATDLDALVHYLHQLSEATRQRFEPHPFDRDAVINFYNTYEGLQAYVAEDLSQQQIIAYAIIKHGCLQHDKERLMSYGDINLDEASCTFAPSVTDQWQGKGIGKLLFHFILSDLKAAGINKIILWGGVQAGNNNAVNFYRNMGFKTLGAFEYNGSNLDMLLEIG
jgi:GNAT superfamily N-acetyltransferase